MVMKISKSCSKVIERTLQSGKNWLRYSLFSVISRVKWPNLRAWPIFEYWKTLQSKLAKHDNVSNKDKFWKNHCRYGLQCIALDKVDSGCAICIWKFVPQEKKFVAWKSAFCPWKRRFQKWRFDSFSQILVDPLPVLASPSNFRVKWTSPNAGLEKWQGFCHPKTISYKNVASKMSFYPSNCHQVSLVFSTTIFFSNSRKNPV